MICCDWLRRSREGWKRGARNRRQLKHTTRIYEQDLIEINRRIRRHIHRGRNRPYATELPYKPPNSSIKRFRATMNRRVVRRVVQKRTSRQESRIHLHVERDHVWREHGAKERRHGIRLHHPQLDRLSGRLLERPLDVERAVAPRPLKLGDVGPVRRLDLRREGLRCAVGANVLYGDLFMTLCHAPTTRRKGNLTMGTA